MKKIIQINLSGRAISIDESAYEHLQQYMQQLRQYFASEESREEILNDIEARISELLHEKLQRSTDHIAVSDLEEVIASIGRPADFADAMETNSTALTPGVPPQQKRLYRDTADRVLGGVCSGIATYLGIDPTIVRLLFAIITLGGFGTGFLIYLVLWILLPQKSLRGESARRLYRNPADRILGGVASGLAAYFQTSVNKVRLIFAAPILLNILFDVLNVFGGSWLVTIGFGGLTGSFVLVYVILWIILPEATTTYQKMEMRGETVDLNRIRQHVKHWGGEVKESAQRLSGKLAGGTQAFSSSKSAGRTALQGLGSVIRFFTYLFLGTIAFALLVGGAAILFAGIVTMPAQVFFWSDTAQQGGFWATIFLFFLVPVLYLFIVLIRRMFRVRRPNPVLHWTFGLLWVLGWVALFWTGISVARDFEFREEQRTTMEVPESVSTRMIIDQSASPYTYTGTWRWIEGDRTGFDITRDTFKVPAVGVRVELSPDSAYHVRLMKVAFGRDPEQAIGRLDKIDFPVLVRDSVLDLGPGFGVSKSEKYRGQHVVVTMLVPLGRSVRFTESVLDNYRWMGMRDVSERDRSDVDSDELQVRLSRYKSGVDYVMGNDGYLLRPDGTKVR